MTHGKTAYGKRFNKEFDGPIIPLGGAVGYLPITSTDKTKCHKLGTKLLPGIFIGYVQHAGVAGKVISSHRQGGDRPSRES